MQSILLSCASFNIFLSLGYFCDLDSNAFVFPLLLRHRRALTHTLRERLTHTFAGDCRLLMTVSTRVQFLQSLDVVVRFCCVLHCFAFTSVLDLLSSRFNKFHFSLLLMPSHSLVSTAVRKWLLFSVRYVGERSTLFSRPLSGE